LAILLTPCIFWNLDIDEMSEVVILKRLVEVTKLMFNHKDEIFDFSMINFMKIEFSMESEKTIDINSIEKSIKDFWFHLIFDNNTKIFQYYINFIKY